MNNGGDRGTNLLRRLIEHLGLRGQCIRALNQIVELLAPRKDRLDRLVLKDWCQSLTLSQQSGHTSTIFVSSNSCWTLMMVSACRGS